MRGGRDRSDADRSDAERFPRVIWIGHLRLAPLEVAAALAAVAVFANLGWDEPLWDGRLQLLLHLIAAAAIGAGVLLVLRGASLPRTRLELPTLALLVLLGVASILGRNLGLAAAALAASVAWACLLPVVLAAIRRRPDVTALVVAIPTLVLATAILWNLVARRLGWLGLGLGLPPVRLGNESTVFGSVAVPPFILLGLLPVCLLAEPRWIRTALLSATGCLLVPLALISGSRSAWVALGVAAVTLAATEAPAMLRHRPAWSRSPRLLIALGLVALPILAVGLAYVAPRFTAVTSLLYRERLWSDTLAAWSTSPVIGIGPGTMPYARQAFADPGIGPVRQPHSHDLAMGVLGDAGLLGLAAGLALVAVFLWVAGPHRARSIRGRAASSVLLGFLAAGLFEDITFLPNFDLIVLVLVAIALLDADAVTWRPLHERTIRAARVAAAVATAGLAVVVLLADGAAVAYRRAADAVWANDWPAATRLYELAVALDPWHPSGPKALAVAADAAGDPATALAAAREATRLNPGDGASWTNLSLLCLEAGDDACAGRAAASAVRQSPTTSRELINAAIVEARLGDERRADELYRLSLVTYRNTAIAVSWPRAVDPNAGWVPVPADASAQVTIALAEAASGEVPTASDDWAPVAKATVLAIRGDWEGAAAMLAAAQREAPFDVLTWQVTAVIELHRGEDASRALRAAEVLSGGPLRFVASQIGPVSYEIASLRIYPRDGLVAAAERLIPVPPWPWALERYLPPP